LSEVGPLVDVDSVPEWLSALVELSGDLDSNAFTRFSPPEGARLRLASVLVLLGEGSNGPDVLLLRRADTLGSHPGQVAFPGGGADDGDGGPVGTALREAEEETGVDPAGVRPVAILPELYVPVSGFVVTPVLAQWVKPSPVRAVDLGETAAVARIAIADLVDPANRFQVRRADGPWKGPAFDVDGMFIWGFTAGLLAVLLALGGWERDWDRADVRNLDVALSDHESRVAAALGQGTADRE
jgi:8-oxo-dGTP pyrophosphatase MutT (NUDIX family)